MGRFVYMYVSGPPAYLPVVIADTAGELAKMLDVSRSCIYQSLWRARQYVHEHPDVPDEEKQKHLGSYRVIYIGDEEETLPEVAEALKKGSVM